MITFPSATRVHKRLPKEAFYKHLPLTQVLKDAFVSDIDRIYVEWSLTKENLHLQKVGDVKEILVMILEMRNQDYSKGILEAIARQNPHKLVFILKYEDQLQTAVYFGKLYASDWRPEEEVSLSAQGSTLDDIWDAFVAQLALSKENQENRQGTLQQDIERQQAIEKLEKEIQKLDKAVWKEKQPTKKFDLYTKLTQLKKELEALTNG